MNSPQHHFHLPASPPQPGLPATRRDFLKLMGASIALAGLHGCTRPPEEHIVPYVMPPTQVVPGKPLFYATAFPFDGYAIGVLAESHTGRPTKIEGNPDHPASLGATNSFAQSSVLQLYDPDRSRMVLNRGNVADWPAFMTAIAPRLKTLRDKKGAGLRILTSTVTSPTFADQMQRLLKIFPETRWHCFDPISRENIYEGTRLAFGQPLDVVYRIENAKTILALDSDFLFADPGALRYARDFIDQRRMWNGPRDMNRLYAVEPTPSITGSMADHRLPMASRKIEDFALTVAGALGVGSTPTPAIQLNHDERRFLDMVAADLRAQRSAALVIAGIYQPPAVHLLAHAMNEMLGSQALVQFIQPPQASPVNSRQSLQDLVNDMRSNRVEMLLIIGANPVYTAPADLDFAEALLALSKAQDPSGASRAFTVHMGLHNDETAWLCQWHIPQSHYLESWSDARAFDGAASIIQPLISPLYRSRSAHDLLSLLLGREDISTYDTVRNAWRAFGGNDFEQKWLTWLEKGVIPGTSYPALQVKFRGLDASSQTQSTTAPGATTRPAATTRPTTVPAGSIEISFRPDPSIWEGSFSNVAWQQELPKPFTKLTWDNAALISPALASQLDLRNEDLVRLICRDDSGATREEYAAVFITPPQARDSVTLYLGYGRTRAGSLGTNAGFNAYKLRTSSHPWFAPGLSIVKTGKHYPLAPSAHYHTIESRSLGDAIKPEVVAAQSAAGPFEGGEHNRRLVRVGTIDAYRKDPEFVSHMESEAGRPPLTSLYPGWKYPGYRWGMVIDLSACIGCNSCVVACQAENNIPTVGKDQVRRAREMHWLRIDEYFSGPPENVAMYHEPVPCMHCETAPCELVCPVGATVHSEGLNAMVYNRCVGTRYCSNNCPYKVRHFNFYLYTTSAPEVVKMQRNPDVTVRSRGVMEKCTYCIQRIMEARIDADKTDQRIPDGRIHTACQQACPTRAITFGDLNDPQSMASKLAASNLNYTLLTELSTQPRTSYLARITNPRTESRHA